MRSRPVRILSLVLLLVSLGLPGLLAAQSVGLGLEKTVPFRVLIDASGKLKSAVPTDATLGEDINRAAIGVAKGLTFEPARVDGQPADIETQLVLVVRFVPQPAGGYQLALKSAALSTESVTRASPVFPKHVNLRNASAIVVSAVAVNPDGSVDRARTRVLQTATDAAGKSHVAEFEKATLDALAKWVFKPDVVGGKPVATEGRMVIQFCAKDCSVPAEPARSAEELALPRALAANISLARAPAGLAPTPVASATKKLRFRVGVDAAGAVSLARYTGEGDADLAELARSRLMAARFFPATVQGRAVASEMSVSVPVLVEGGQPRLQMERLGYEVQLLGEPWPFYSDAIRRGGADARIRLRIVTGPGGKGDVKASRIESLELSPDVVSIRHSTEAGLRQSFARARIEPVIVDGVEIPVEFVRSFTVCSDATRKKCTFEPSAGKASDWETKLPPGIVLAVARP